MTGERGIQQCEYPACTREAKYASEGGLFCAVPHPYIERTTP